MKLYRGRYCRMNGVHLKITNRNALRTERGATVTEYATIVAICALALASAIGLMRTGLEDGFTVAATAMAGTQYAMATSAPGITSKPSSPNIQSPANSPATSSSEPNVTGTGSYCSHSNWGGGCEEIISLPVIPGLGETVGQNPEQDPQALPTAVTGLVTSPSAPTFY